MHNMADYFDKLALKIIIFLTRWRFVSPMLTHRRCTCAVSTGSQIFVIGGHDGAQILNTIECYDVNM